MRILADLFTCQTKFRFRGIGRYSLSLISEMAKQRGTNEITVLADPLMPESFEELRQPFHRALPAGSFLPYHHPAVSFESWEAFAVSGSLAQPFIRQAYRQVAPDCVLTPSFFDGLNEKGYVPLPVDDPPYVQAMILYDLIPYIFSDQYLDPNPEIKTWYLNRLHTVNTFDLILAISESTRQDAIHMLGIHPDKIVNISGAASPIFRKLSVSAVEKEHFLQRMHLQRPYVLYIGGDDHRKNMEGALRAFASLPRDVIDQHQLVLNDVGDLGTFRLKARAFGLRDEDYVVTGRLKDEDLIALYNFCKISIYPSLYEGFGLPILEAMSCGAPVIASKNSSIPEVIGREDAMFDVANHQDVTQKLLTALTGPAYLEELAEFGSRRATLFSWPNTARRAWDAIESFRREKEKAQRTTFLVPALENRRRIAYVSPLPPDKSGVAEYSAALLPYLGAFFKIDLFTGIGLEVTDQNLRDHFQIYAWNELLDRKNDYETVIYHVGNSDFHAYMAELLQDFPGIVVTHDFFLSNIPYVMEYGFGNKDIFAREIHDQHGLRGLIDIWLNGVEIARMNLPVNWKFLRNAQEWICHSSHQVEMMRQFYGHGWKPEATIIRQLRESPQAVSQEKKMDSRRQVGIDVNAFVFCSFGLMAPTKLNNDVIRAFHRMLAASHKNALLIFVGPPPGG